MRPARIAAVLIIVLTALPQGHEPALDSWLQRLLAEDEAQLAGVVQEIEAGFARAAMSGPAARREQARLVEGAVNFFRPFPGGNGRACVTCHDPRDGFSLSPARVETRWQRLQRARRHDSAATDPLFRPIDADDGAEDFTLLRARALIKVRVPLPSRVRLTDDPLATHVTFSRAVTPLNMLKHTAPYQQDRSASTLEAQALAAVNQHMEPTVQPSLAFLESVAAFQRHIFSSSKVQEAVDRHRSRPPSSRPGPAADGARTRGEGKVRQFLRTMPRGAGAGAKPRESHLPAPRRVDEPGVHQCGDLEPAPARLSAQPHPRARIRSGDPTLHG